MLPGWFYLPDLAVSVEFTQFTFRWLLICQGKLVSLNERIGTAEYVIEGWRNVEKENRSGNRETLIAFGFIIGLYK